MYGLETFSLAYFSILSLFCGFCLLTLCYEAFLFWSCLFDALQNRSLSRDFGGFLLWPSSSVSSLSPDPLPSTWYILPAKQPTEHCIWLIEFSFSSFIQLRLSSIFLFLYSSITIFHVLNSLSYFIRLFVFLSSFNQFFPVLSQLSWVSVKSLNMFAIAIWIQCLLCHLSHSV